MEKKSSLTELPRFLDERGNLAVIEQLKDVPFKIERVHWIYDVPGGGEREGHAYHRNEEFIVALSGSFTVVIDDGEKEESFILNRCYQGIYIPKMTWRLLTDFSTNAVAMVLSSTPYDESDYILDYNEYKHANH